MISPEESISHFTVLEHKEKVTAGSLIEIGKSLRGGAYFAEVIQGNQRRVVKIIKVN